MARVAVAVCLVAAVVAGAEWRRVTAPLALSFPRDHGAHLEYRTEWWYVTGTLATADGRRIGVQLTFFRRGIDPESPRPEAAGMAARQVLAAHLALANESAGRLRFAQRVRRAAAGLAGYSEDDLAVWVETWRLERRADGALRASADDPAAGIGVDLTLVPETSIVRNGDGGVSAKGGEAGNASAYLTWPRMRTTGQVRIDGATLDVSGESWVDHEWGSSQLGAGVVGWDWLGVRLADGRSLMAFRLRRADGGSDEHSAGTLVERNGSVRALTAAEVTVQPMATWRSTRSGAAYPVRMRVRVPSAGLDLELRPWLADAEVAARSSTGVVYWEGPVSVSGSATGEGYLELTGYAGTMAGRF